MERLCQTYNGHIIVQTMLIPSDVQQGRLLRTSIVNYTVEKFNAVAHTHIRPKLNKKNEKDDRTLISWPNATVADHEMKKIR